MAAKKGAPSPNPTGRPVGSKSKANKLRDKALARILAGKKNPLDFLLTVMNDAESPIGTRIDCAKAAAPYVHKKMPIQIENSDAGPFRVLDPTKLSGMTEAELMNLRALISKAQPDEEVVSGQ